MLILSRRSGESLMIRDDIIVTVIGIKGNQVRLGITAPKEVSVHREEIYQRIHHETMQDNNNSNTEKIKLAVPIISQKRKRKLNTINLEKTTA